MRAFKDRNRYRYSLFWSKFGSVTPRLLALAHEKSLLLLGPRGTGKSTWVREVVRPDVLVDLLSGDRYARLLARPSDLEALLVPGVRTVAIDEVQRVPELLHEVHRLIEARGVRFVLTGSSARKLRRGGVNLLAGRALTARMHPLTAAELGPAFDLDRALRFGQLPAILTEPDPAHFLASYVQTYLREEVQQEGLTRNVAGFARFLEAASFSHASLLNMTAIAREASVDRKTVEAWFTVLEDLLLAHRLEPFTRRAKRASVQHPKFYFFDAGVFRALRPKGPLDRPEEIAGAALEGLVHQELRAVNDALGLGYSLHFWRTPSGSEVDFVLYGERGLWAIEVKHAREVRPADLRSLRAFGDDYPEARRIVVTLGHEREAHGTIEVWPAAMFLRALPELLA